MTTWSPARYLRFEDERTRPARDLLAGVPLHDARRVVDIGCGPGNSTELLAERFPSAAVIGLDNSAEMLASARARLPSIAFVESDVATWMPDEPVDLLFGNAVFQWVPDHLAVLGRLMDRLAAGGALAVQMPDNSAEASHLLMRETAAVGPWAQALRDAASDREKIAPAAVYYDRLRPKSARVDVWRTTYHHPLADAATVVAWFESTGLRPYLSRLDPPARAAFLAAYEARVARAYPPRADGRVLLGFPRLFVVAVRE